MSWYATKKASKLPALDKSRILVFDTETTGTRPTDEILQITILDGYGTTLFDSFIRPKRNKHWKEAEAVNNISYQMVEDKPFFADVKAEIQGLFNNALLVVGYNVNFDINFVKAEGIVVSGQIFDVMTAFASYRANVDKSVYRKCKLVECAEYFGHSYSPHDSAEDAKVTLACFNDLISDPRFTTYKAKEKKALKKQSSEAKTSHETSFTLQFATHRRRNMAFYGVFLIVVAELLLFFMRNKIVADPVGYCSWMKNILANWNADPVESALYILIGIGCLLVVVGFFRLLFRIPQILTARFQHFFNRFK